MAYKAVPKGCDFSTEFPAWIIAYCPDINSWFCTNQRFYYYEFANEFQDEKDAINYFENHIEEFVGLSNEMCPNKTNSVFLINTKKWYT